MKQELDFIVIGAQKSGTTSLFEYLRRHPEICLPLDKEAPFFSHDTILGRGWDNYIQRTFANADPQCKWGTITPHYMAGSVYDSATLGSDGSYDERTVPSRIRERLPNVRLVALLRDPVERALSHHQMAVMSGIETRSLTEAVEDLLGRESLERARRQPEEATAYIVWGEYGRILAGFLDVFSREQILILFTNELEQTPHQLLGRLHQHLNVASDFIPDNLGTRYREGKASRRFSTLNPYRFQEVVTDAEVTRALWHTIPKTGRRWIDRRFAQMSYRLDLWNQQGESRSEPDGAALALLREHFKRDTEELVRLFDVDPPWHQSPGVE